MGEAGLSEWEENLNLQFMDLEKGFEKMDGIRDPAKGQKHLKELSGKMAECKRLIKEFEREARTEGMAEADLKVKKKGMVDQLNNFMLLKKTLASELAQKQKLLEGGGARGDGEDGDEFDMEAGPRQRHEQDMSNQELIEVGREKIKETDESLARSARVVQDTIAIGAETAATLQQQTKQMERVVDDLDEIQFTMKRASRLIRDITRSMATDRCIMLFLFIIFLGVCVIVVLKFFGKDGGAVQIPGEENIPGLGGGLSPPPPPPSLAGGGGRSPGEGGCIG